MNKSMAILRKRVYRRRKGTDFEKKCSLKDNESRIPQQYLKAELNSKPTACLCERTLNDKRNTHGKLQLGFACGSGSLEGPNRQTMGQAWACQIPVRTKQPHSDYRREPHV